MSNCNSVLLSNIARDCATNVGGIRKVWLAIFQENMFTTGEKADVEGYADQGTWVTGVTSGATWYEYNFRKGTGSMTSTLNVDDTNGINYVQTDLSLVFAKLETYKRTRMVALATAEVCAIVEDCNGKFWALGFNEPVSSTAGGAETGVARGDANQYTLTLTDISAEYPYEVSPTVVEGLKTN